MALAAGTSPMPGARRSVLARQEMPVIVVTYNSEVLGSGEFWRGPEDALRNIRNIPARRLAEKVAADGKTRSVGMWTAEKREAADSSRTPEK